MLPYNGRPKLYFYTFFQVFWYVNFDFIRHDKCFINIYHVYHLLLCSFIFFFLLKTSFNTKKLTDNFSFLRNILQENSYLYFYIFVIHFQILRWKPPSLSELTTTIIHIELTQLGSEESNSLRFAGLDIFHYHFRVVD